ncbi:TetR family transcriptional regulator [Rhizobium sp. XQZ8]|uniref:TetR family transcriptional regulator n=1 Tax=Rhizobium populisoli TaxID=2859785 RepID=UPI001CA59AAE|nr:TetR family transcriptional regulator [Rhizobium populisoli]MBW6421683.1 TetR family transcriptional regulator [Rhizobium populisoli]
MRNAEATREKILDAALAEFSAYGIAGARVDRIAKTAGCNKNLIYIYFDSKDGLFAAVLSKNLTGAYEAVPFTPDDLPDYAAKVFDFAMANPEVMRLMAWFNLEQKPDGLPARQEAADAKIKQIKAAQDRGELNGALPPAFLLTSLMTLATAWTAAGAFGGGLDPDAKEKPERLRDHISEAVRLLSANKTGR